MEKPIIEQNLTEPGKKEQPTKNNFDWHRFFTFKKSTKTKINWFKAAKYIYPITILIIIGVLIWFMSFLYDNVYTTMSQATELSGLKSKVVEERLNLEQFNLIIDKIKEKEKIIDWDDTTQIISPFAFGDKGIIKNTSTIATATATATTAVTSTKATSTPAKK